MFGQLSTNGKILNRCSFKVVDSCIELPDDAKLGDFLIDGKLYHPENSYSVPVMTNGVLTWIEDKDAKNEYIDLQREAAYKNESDNLYLSAQYDGTVESMAKWRNKVAEIKARYPRS